jgi:Protein of unknown function (DUF5818)
MNQSCLHSLVTVVLCGFTLAAQNTVAEDKADKSKAKAQVTMKGTLKADGEKYTFVNDKDGKTWDVANPEELKGHEGHHVQVTGRVYADKDAINVMSVKMLKGGVEGGPPTGDNPPKRPPPLPPPPSK